MTKDIDFNMPRATKFASTIRLEQVPNENSTDKDKLRMLIRNKKQFRTNQGPIIRVSNNKKEISDVVGDQAISVLSGQNVNVCKLRM